MKISPKIIVAITGATGAPLAIKVLELLNDLQVDIHLIISSWGKTTLQQETALSYQQVCSMATKVYDNKNQAANISSGSHLVDGMIIVPCSMKTLAAIRAGFGENLITRCADVQLKERRPLVIVPRETPFNSIHLENMLALSRMNCSIFPLMPAFYNDPQSIDDLLTHMAVRILDQLKLHHHSAKPWGGFNSNV